MSLLQGGIRNPALKQPLQDRLAVNNRLRVMGASRGERLMWDLCLAAAPLGAFARVRYSLLLWRTYSSTSYHMLKCCPACIPSTW